MIKIIGKYTKYDEIVAWEIEDDGVVYNIAANAVYHEFYFQSLLESGYKFYNYHMNITTEDGLPIQDVRESTSYLSDTDLIDLIDSIEVGMVDQVQALKYFAKTEYTDFVNVLTPEDPPIKTREEFVAHLDTIARAKSEGVYVYSNYSINSIVAKNALFTLEEVVANVDDAKLKFIKMFDGHTLTSMDDLESLYKRYGINDTMNDDEVELAILKGYFEYGVPGINANIVSIKYILPLDNYSSSGDSKLKYGIKNNKTSMFFSEDVYGVDVYSLQGEDPFYNTNAHIGASNISSVAKEAISRDYTSVAYGDKKTQPYVEIKLISTDGIAVSLHANCNEAHLYRNGVEMLHTLKMFNVKTIDNVIIPLSRVIHNSKGYIADSVLIRSYISKCVQESTVVPKYSNSFKMMLGIGVSPYYAPLYINRLIGAGVGEYIEIQDSAGFANLHGSCSETFRIGLSDSILSKYGVDDDDFTSRPIEEQIEYINGEIDYLQSQGKYLVKPEIPQGILKLANAEYNEWLDEYQANEIGNVNFVLSLMSGEQNIGKYALGMVLDNHSNEYKLFNIVYSAYMAAKYDNPDITCAEFLSNTINVYIDNNLLFKPRKDTALGCLKDMTIFRSDMSNNASTLVLVTKVFRDNSNTVLEECRRHYGFECMAYDKGPGSRGNQIYKSIYEQIVNNLYGKGLSANIAIAGDSASKLIVDLYMKKVNVVVKETTVEIPYSITLMDGVKFNTTINMGKEYYISLSNGSLFRKYYSSSYDFCENQFSRANLNCDYYCVNASISPWSIVPRDGFKIPEYNLFINYFSMDELKKSLPESVITRIETSESKVFKCLRETFTANELFPKMPSVFSKADEVRLAREGFFLERREIEDIEAYIARTTFVIKEAKVANKSVKHTVLKSDTQYASFKPYAFPEEVSTSTTFYTDYSAQQSNRYITVMTPRLLDSNWLTDSGSTNAYKIESSRVKLERVKFSDIDFDAKLWNIKLCNNDFNPIANVYISESRLYYKNNKSKVVFELDEASMRELCEEGIAIQISNNTYIIKTITGLLKVGI